MPDVVPPVLRALEPVAERLIERHLSTTKEWFPHEYVPWSRGRDFEAGESWSPEEADLAGASLTEAGRSSLYVNLLTEDNLPYYFRDIQRMFSNDGAWGEWTRRWTAEEGRHAIVIRDYLTVTRALDPWELERSRMAQVQSGRAPEPVGPINGWAYLAIQELATRISHHNTGKIIGDPVGEKIMSRVAFDENLHFLFYRDMVSAVLEYDPSATVIALEQEVRNFAMPGQGIPGFDRHAGIIARAGVYDLALHHDRILQPLIHATWKVGELEGLSPEADKARESMLKRVERTGRLSRRLVDRRCAEVAAEPAEAAATAVG